MTDQFVQDQAIIKWLKEILEAHLENEHFGVTELAKAAGLSRSSLHRKVHAYYGNSTSQFIREYRLQKAMEVLVHTDARGRFAVPVHRGTYLVAVDDAPGGSALTTPGEYEAAPPREGLFFGLAAPAGRAASIPCIPWPLVGLLVLFTFNRIRGAILERNRVLTDLAAAEDRLRLPFKEDMEHDIRA